MLTTISLCWTNLARCRWVAIMHTPTLVPTSHFFFPKNGIEHVTRNDGACGSVLWQLGVQTQRKLVHPKTVIEMSKPMEWGHFFPTEWLASLHVWCDHPGFMCLLSSTIECGIPGNPFLWLTPLHHGRSYLFKFEHVGMSKFAWF